MEELKAGYVRFGVLQKKVRVLKPAPKKKNEIDVSLSVLCSLAERGDTLTTQEIADVCGCSQSLISDTARTAIKKLRGEQGLLLRDFV